MQNKVDENLVMKDDIQEEVYLIIARIKTYIVRVHLRALRTLYALIVNLQVRELMANVFYQHVLPFCCEGFADN